MEPIPQVGPPRESLEAQDRGEPGADLLGSGDASSPVAGDGLVARSDPEEAEHPREIVVGSGQLSELTTRVARLAELFEERLVYDQFKERQITQLHEELQAHRQGLLERALRPLLMGLVRLHDELGRVRDHLSSTPSEARSADQVDLLVEGFQDDVELLLDQNGVNRSCSQDDRFDPRLQTSVGTVPTDDLGRIGAIARRVRAGFERDGVPLRKERVEVFVAAAAGVPVTPGAVSAVPKPSDEEDPQ